MNNIILSNAIENINDRYILEAYEYRQNLTIYKKVWKLGIAVFSVYLVAGVISILGREKEPSIIVYAYESAQQLTKGKPVLLPGQIDDNGQMVGHPLMFYVLGSEIESIRFSCKNERISFVDWTEQRGDFILCKNFTVSYGSKEDDYYYLVVDWVPQNIIRKLTDNSDIGIADLLPEEKKDIIVMEVTYLDGRSETLAVNISLNTNGQFIVNVSEYEIRAEDGFIFQPDSMPSEHCP